MNYNNSSNLRNQAMDVIKKNAQPSPYFNEMEEEVVVVAKTLPAEEQDNQVSKGQGRKGKRRIPGAKAEDWRRMPERRTARTFRRNEGRLL